MTIPSSGTIALTTIQTEFGGSNPIGLSEYYRGGTYVPNTAQNAGIPTSGTIQLDDFYGSSSVVGLLATLTGSGIIYANGGAAPVFDTSGNVYSYVQNAQIEKYTAAGALSFQKVASAGTSPGFRNAYIDASNNIFVAGYNSGAPAIYKYDTSGNCTFGTGITYTGMSGAFYSCVTDSSGNIYAAGYAKVTGSYNTNTVFIAKFNSSGALQWGYPYSPAASASTGFGVSIGLDSSNNIYVAGGVTVFSGSYVNHPYIIKFNSSGSIVWQYYLYTSAATSGSMSCAQTDSSGNTYIVGSESSYIVSKINSSGSIVWQKTIAVSGSFNANDAQQMVLDETNGYIYFTSGNTGSAFYIIKMDFSGNLIWVRSLTRASGLLTVNGIGLSSDKQKLCVSFAVYSVSGIGTFVAPTDGTKLGTYSLGGTNYTYASTTFTVSSGSLPLAAGGFSLLSVWPYSTPSISPTNTTSSYTSNIVLI